jgi:hypothetical protein
VIGETKDFTVAHAKQQRICHTCSSDWEKNALQKHGILKIVFGDNVVGRTQNLAWFSRLACLGGVVFTVFELSGRLYTGRICGVCLHSYQQRQTKYRLENCSQVRHLVRTKPGCL